MRGQKIITICLYIILINTTKIIFSNEINTNFITAYFTNDKIILDGHLDEIIWSKATHINNFRQREPNEGQAATEKTEVAIVYDKNNLYIGVWCYQNDPSKIIAKFMQQDFQSWTEDNFHVVISTFNDNKNGYLFTINPLGARADAQVFSRENANRDWNGVWDARTQITEEGWFAEIVIPFNTFQFKNIENQIWAINFERNIKSKNEELSWQGWARNHSINSISQAGKLNGIKNISYKQKFELKPYLLTGFEKKEEESKLKIPLKTGLDMNVNLSPTLKLNLTTNTDFAQIEVDRIAVNLSRFDLYYPEKRSFFLENKDLFSFTFGQHNDVFYTRKIGIENNESVRIIAGGRLTGKIHKHNIGFLSIQTEKLDTIPSTNNTVFRYKLDIGEQSYIGGILTSKTNDKISNQVVGIDARYSSNNFLKNKNLIIYGNLARSFTKNLKEKNPYAFRFFINYPNDLIKIGIAITGIYEGFNPYLGFLQRNYYELLQWRFQYEPRWKNKLNIKKFQFRPWDFTIYRNPSTKIIESFNNSTSLFSFEFVKGHRFSLNFLQSYDNLENSFDLADGEITIPVNEYWMHKTSIQLSTFKARRFWIDFNLSWGEFYTGTIESLRTSCGINFNQNLNFSANYNYNYLDLPEGNIVSNEFSSNINYAFNPRLNLSLFSQYNSLNEILFFNFKLHWIPKIGSELYIVYNRGYEEIRTQLDLLKPNISTGVTKLVWRFAF